MAGITPSPEEKEWFYDSPEFSLPNGETDYDVKTEQERAFNNISVATDVSIRTDQNISFKFNSTSNDAISLSSTEGSLNFNSLRVTDIYFTNASGSTANIKLFMTGRV